MCACVRGGAAAQEWRAFADKAPSSADTTKLIELDFEADAAYVRYKELKGWFSCDSACTEAWQVYEAAAAARDAQGSKVNTAQAAANAELGLFSTVGVSAARDLFWQRVGAGKDAAKRATWWDLFLVGFRSLGRDESLVSFLIEMVLRFLLNLIVGIFMSVVIFLFAVWRVILSFNPNPVSALAFFALSALMASSFFLTIVMAIGGSVVLAAVGLSQAGAARLADGSGGRLLEAHYD